MKNMSLSIRWQAMSGLIQGGEMHYGWLVPVLVLNTIIGDCESLLASHPLLHNIYSLVLTATHVHPVKFLDQPLHVNTLCSYILASCRIDIPLKEEI